MRLLEVDTQLQVLEHDRFEHALAPVVGPFLVPEHLVQRIEGPAGAADFQEFYKRRSVINIIVINRTCVYEPVCAT